MAEFRKLYPKIGAVPKRVPGPPKRVRTPLAEPVRGRKNTAAYNVHSYPTKVPPEAIEPFIKRFSKPGQVILDPFCGSGMTGVAARRTGRIAVLNDLSPGATHLAWNMSQQCDPNRLADAAHEVMDAVSEDFDRLYAASGPNGEDGRIAWTLHSRIIACPECLSPSSLWHDATNRETGTVAKEWECRACGAPILKRDARVLGSHAVWVAVDGPDGRVERPPTPTELASAESVSRDDITDWYPEVPLGPDREMFIRCALHLQGIREVADFWSARNLKALARLWREIMEWPDRRIRQGLALAFTNTAWHATRMRRYNARGGQRPLTGTLYIPQLSIEVNPLPVFAHKVRQLQSFYAETATYSGESFVTTGSATRLRMDDASADYCFTDPPFGSNIFYGDCAVVWESWLGDLTPGDEEAVVNRSLRPSLGGKSVEHYAVLMEESFREIERVLKPTAWATVVFNSSDAEIWSALRAAVEHAGFDLANASYLDKTQQSHKGYKGRSGAEDVPAFDIILNLHKPGKRRRRPKPPGGYRDAAKVLSKHLATLPPVGEDVEADRQRSLPFLHSLLVQEHFNGSLGLEVGRYALVRRLCQEEFESDSAGRWRLRSESK